MASRHRLRRPEYTGRNRCWPCTGVNITILAIFLASLGYFRPIAASLLGVAGGTLIWLRGYLIPFTPTIAPLLVGKIPGQLFGHAPTADSLGELDPADVDDEDVLQALVDAGVITVEGDRLGLADDVARAWTARMDDLAESAHRDLAGAAEGVDGVESARIEDAGTKTFLVVSGGSTVWLRRPVAIAEIGAVAALEGTDLPTSYHELAAHALCAFLETCPACGDDVVEARADDCCGNTAHRPDQDPPRVLTCETCDVAFYALDPSEEA